MDSFDYVIIGAGSAGCVLAARLSESGRHKVLLLEAGPTDRRFWIHTPIGYGKTFYDPTVNWMYRTQPEAGLGARVIYQPRGKVLGGSSSINAMVYSRGQPADFDAWKALGNKGWGWQDVLAVYRRMEDHALGASSLHGSGGPLRVSTIDEVAHPLTRLFIEACREIGIQPTTDLNGATIEGAGHYQINTKGGLRMSAARAYLRPARRRANLRIETDALATRIRFEGRRASSVLYERHGHTYEARAGREVILCAGAINSPQLLQLSGIGPAEILSANGVAVLVDAPQVGANLQDHLCYDHVYRGRLPSLNQEFGPLLSRLRAGLRYLLLRSGPLALSVNQGGAFMRTNAGFANPNMQLYFSPLSYERVPPGVRAMMKPDPFPGFCTSASPCRPTSLGSVTIASPDPHQSPQIRGNYLSTDHDVAEILAGARVLRALAATSTLSALIEAELKPGPATASDDDLLADIRERSYSVFHPCGSCRMGPDPARAVVDPCLRVHGLDGLRVADASIFPLITSGNTNAPAIMVGERASDLVLESALGT